MSVVASWPNMLTFYRRSTIRARAEAAGFAGRYKVVRMELGAVTRRLYYIITDQLSAFLREKGIDYTFPRLEEVGENKSGLIQAMHLFNQKYPDHGLLLVVDEVLDYCARRMLRG